MDSSQNLTDLIESNHNMPGTGFCMLGDRRTQKVRLFDRVVFGYFSTSGFAAKDAFRKGHTRAAGKGSTIRPGDSSQNFLWRLSLSK